MQIRSVFECKFYMQKLFMFVTINVQFWTNNVYFSSIFLTDYTQGVIPASQLLLKSNLYQDWLVDKWKKVWS